MTHDQIIKIILWAVFLVLAIAVVLKITGIL